VPHPVSGEDTLRHLNKILWVIWVGFYPFSVPITAIVCYVVFRWFKPELRTDFKECFDLAHGAWSKEAKKYAER
jgi:hypothetical protein